MPEARELAARAWCKSSTADKTFDPVLCEAFSEILADTISERDALRVEYESRVIWIKQMCDILGYDNSDGFHCKPDAFEIAMSMKKALSKSHETLKFLSQSCVIKQNNGLVKIIDETISNQSVPLEKPLINSPYSQ